MDKIKTKKQIMWSQLFYVFLIPMLIHSIYDTATRQVVRNTSLETTATITQVVNHGSDGNSFIVVEYEIDGVLYSNSINVIADARTYVGENIVIYYVPSNHNNINLGRSDNRAIDGFPVRTGFPGLLTTLGLLIYHNVKTFLDIKKLKRAKAEMRIQSTE